MSEIQSKENVNFLQSFVNGASNGLKIAFTSMLPNVLFAFAIIQILNLSGLTDVIGVFFDPIMKIFGLPGIAATAIVAALLSTGGGYGVAAALATAGDIDAKQAGVLLVGIMLLGSLIQYIGRILGPIGIPTKHYPILITINLFVAFLGMFVTKLVIP